MDACVIPLPATEGPSPCPGQFHPQIRKTLAYSKFAHANRLDEYCPRHPTMLWWYSQVIWRASDQSRYLADLAVSVHLQGCGGSRSLVPQCRAAGPSLILAAPPPGDYLEGFDECALLHSEPAAGHNCHESSYRGGPRSGPAGGDRLAIEHDFFRFYGLQ